MLKRLSILKNNVKVDQSFVCVCMRVCVCVCVCVCVPTDAHLRMRFSYTYKKDAPGYRHNLQSYLWLGFSVMTLYTVVLGKKY